MLTGWFTDKDGHKYYLSTADDTYLGSMLTGWRYIDGKRYYFRENEGGPKGSLDESR